MIISAGVIITNGTVILLGHTTNAKHWDIPKGIIDDNESPIEACIRETREETDVHLDRLLLEDLGVHRYRRDKKLHLFRYEPDTLPLIDNMSCTSFFEKYGNQVPEIDDFKYVPISYLKYYTTENMFNTLSGVLNE